MKIPSVIPCAVLAIATIVCGCSSSDELARENVNQIIRSGSRSIQMEPQADTYIIRAGDQIQLSVWGYPEFATTTSVKENGTVAVPLIGDIGAVGLTKEQFTNTLRQKLSEYLQGEVKVSVTVSSTTTQKVSVLGEVIHQENYALTTDVSLLEALTTAGGTTSESDLRHIRILHGGLNREIIEVDLTSYLESGNIDALPMVRPGDTIFIPKRSNAIRDLSDFLRDAIFIFGFFRVFN